MLVAECLAPCGNWPKGKDSLKSDAVRSVSDGFMGGALAQGEAKQTGNNGHLETVKALTVAKTDVIAKDKDGCPALHQCALKLGIAYESREPPMAQTEGARNVSLEFVHSS